MNARLNPTPIDVEQAIGQLAVELPGSTAVFRRLKLDFCCGGHLSLRQATSERGLDLDAVAEELSALQRPSTLPDVGTPSELIDHLVARYHEVHRMQLPELIRMARRVEHVHQGRPHVPAGLADTLEAMQHELLTHMHKEEAVLFPMLKSGGNSFVAQPIAMMRHEHNDHGAALERVAELTGDITPPPNACNTWRALYSGLAQLRDDLMNHIHLENNILFPQFERAAAQGGSCSGGGQGGCGCSGG